MTRGPRLSPKAFAIPLVDGKGNHPFCETGLETKAFRGAVFGEVPIPGDIDPVLEQVFPDIPVFGEERIHHGNGFVGEGEAQSVGGPEYAVQEQVVLPAPPGGKRIIAALQKG